VITLDAGPEELPGTANVILEVEEVKRPFSGDLGMFSKPETKAWTLEGTVKYKNLAGLAETLDATGCYGLATTSELSAGVTYPRFKGLPASLATRLTLLTQDWQRYSSYRERLTGFSVGLVGDNQHDISYNLTWRDLKDPSRSASKSVRRQLGHSLLSAVKYTYRRDTRDSVFRPRRGIAFISTTQIAGLGPDAKLLRFARQEVELRLAIPLGLANAALNLGVAGGIILPWGPGYKTKATPIGDRFYVGGHSSLLGELKGPSALLGFRTRGVGPNELRRTTTSQTNKVDSEVETTLKRDTLGGDLAVSGFADISFDLPMQFLKSYGIHAHTFACAGNLVPLTGDNTTQWSLRNFLSGFRVSSGAGIVIPTKLFRLEVNYCYLLRYQENDRIKRGVQISLNSPQ
jgi:outer membrane protein insertion porin family